MGLVGAMDMTDNMMLRGIPEGTFRLYGQKDAKKPGGTDHRGTGNRDSRRHHPGAQAVRGQCPEGFGGKGRFLPIPRCLWWHIRSADWISTHPTPSTIFSMSRRNRSGRYLRRRGSGCAPGAVRPYSGAVRRTGKRCCGRKDSDQGTGGADDDQDRRWIK